MVKSKKIWNSGAKAVIGAIILIIALFPIYWLVLMGIRPESRNMEVISLIPKDITFKFLDSFFRKKDLMLH